MIDSLREGKLLTKLQSSEPLDEMFKNVLGSDSCEIAQLDFNSCNFILTAGYRSGLAVIDKFLFDITRLSSKLSIAPESGIVATSVIGNSTFDT